MDVIGKAALSSQLKTTAKKYGFQPKSDINWEDYNYPPFLLLIHYKPSELSNPHRQIAFFLWLSHIIILVISIINFINNIVQVSVDSASGYRILFSGLFFFILNALAGLSFYKGLQAFLEESNKITFYIIAGLLSFGYIAFLLGGFLNFNGFLRMKDVSTAPKIFCVIESVLYIIACLANGFFIFKSVKWENGPAKVETSNTERNQGNSSAP